MANMSPTKVPMPEQPAQIRNKNFSEVATGYTPEMAMEEAARCLNCKHKPCVSACPVNVRIPEFITLVASGEFIKAYEIIKTTNSLPAVSGRVCPQEKQCESKCVRGIKGESVAIGRLERFCADYYLEHSPKIISTPPVMANPKKVAIIGAGPAGLSCAGNLVDKGYDVTIFEAFHTPGGVLVYGIPEFRLPKAIVSKEIELLKSRGVKIQTNMVIGKILTIDEIMEEFSACFIGSGAGLPRFMNIKGEGLIGVYSANEYLTRTNLMKAYLSEYETPILESKSVAVIGGGNVAMDAARCAKRLGADNVYIVYRRGFEEMPARLEEVHHAMEEGIEFKNLSNPIGIIGDENGQVSALECVEIQLGDPDETGRRKPNIKENSNFNIEVDTVIMAIGTSPNPLIKATTKGLEFDNRGCLIVDPQTMATTKTGVYAGGDTVTGAATVILAMGAGQKAAESIHKFLQN